MPQHFCAPEGFDSRRFDELVAMMGDQGDRLITHVIDDLGRIRAGLDGPAPTRAQLRDNCHMLVALAGTLGGHALQVSADALYHRAETEADCDPAETLRHLDGLLAWLATRKIAA